MFATTGTMGPEIGSAFWWIAGAVLYLLGVVACYVLFLKTAMPDPETYRPDDENDA